MTEKIATGKPLSAGQLAAAPDPQWLAAFARAAGETAGKDADPWFAQERALEAIRLAARLDHEGFNLFVLGDAGLGRHEALDQLLTSEARSRPQPSDWIYVNNFEFPEKPSALPMPPGKAVPFRKAMEDLVDDLANDIPAIFESDDYQTRRRTIEQRFSEKHEEAFERLIESAREKELAVLRTPMGFAIAPVRDGKPITPEEFEKLPEAEQEAINDKVTAAQTELEAVLKQIPRREKEHRRAVEELNAEMAKGGVNASIEPVTEAFGEIPGIKQYLEAVRADLVENAEIFLDNSPETKAGAFPVATTKHYKKPEFQRYAVNVVVSNAGGTKSGAPVVRETLPSLANLVGRIEHASEMGTLVTNFTMIKPGALHRANGGYLVLDISDVLSEPFAWDALKRSLKTGEISIVSAAERFSLITTTSLEPDPIPLRLRVILVGERIYHYLLTVLDPDYAPLFRLQADFNEDAPLDEKAVIGLAAIAGALRERNGLLAPDAQALSRLLLETTRIAGDSQKISLNREMISEILCEADFWARENGDKTITAGAVERAITEGERRASRPRDRIHEAITRDIIDIRTDGMAVGQANALSVHEIGRYRFGRPSLVTARVRMGKGKVVDIEREVELGGPLHSKGVLILSGYLAATYAPEMPLSLWASIVFEQSYGGIDGDSASAAELFVLLSALSGMPIEQSFAITGSVNQHGRIQAIGGVNEKIEGFFDICASRGLTGRQGVLIPASNVVHLALRPRVIEAVSGGKFSIIPISTIDEGISILTGRPAGERDEQGSFPDGSVNAAVEERLLAFARRLRDFSKGSND